MINLEKLSESDKQKFLDYLQNHFVETQNDSSGYEAFLENWNSIILEAKEKSAAEIINSRLIPDRQCNFIEPDNISIEMYKAIAGNIPVIKIRNAKDFESFQTNYVYKGVYHEEITSTGAAFISGKKIRLIALSCKPYSNVSAKTLNLDDEDWKDKSMKIRLSHECTHFYTKTFFGTAKNHLHDELMADFFGLYDAFGEYKAEFFEYFMGVKGTEGTRLRCYIPDCSETLLEVIKETASVCANWLENWSKSEEFKKMTKEERLRFLCKINLRDILNI